MSHDPARALHGDGHRSPSPHRFDPGSLLAAALFAAVAVVGLSGRTVSLSRELRWIWPILFLGSGAALLVSAAARARESAPTTAGADGWGGDAADDRRP